MRDDIEEEDVEEAYYRYMEENPMAGVLQDEQDDLMVEYDNDGNIIFTKQDKVCTISHFKLIRLLEFAGLSASSFFRGFSLMP